MSTKNAEIPTKVLRKAAITHVPVLIEGEVDTIRYTEINGVLLVPVTDAELWNTSKSTLRRLIRAGKLKAYHGNGQLKTNSRSTRVYFDLHEYIALDNNNL